MLTCRETTVNAAQMPLLAEIHFKLAREQTGVKLEKM